MCEKCFGTPLKKFICEASLTGRDRDRSSFVNSDHSLRSVLLNPRYWVGLSHAYSKYGLLYNSNTQYVDPDPYN